MNPRLTGRIEFEGVAFTFRMRANEAATLEVETLVQLDGAEELVNVFKRYRLEEEPENE